MATIDNFHPQFQLLARTITTYTFQFQQVKVVVVVVVLVDAVVIHHSSERLRFDDVFSDRMTFDARIFASISVTARTCIRAIHHGDVKTYRYMPDK